MNLGSMQSRRQQRNEDTAAQGERVYAVAKLRILFVDSDSYTCVKMQKALEATFEVQCVATIDEAKHYLDINPPDMLISEVLLGQESGLSLCAYVRQTEALQKLPIMLLTSLSTIYDKVAGFEAGTDDYVIKPFDSAHLIARVKLLARIKHLEPRIS